MCFPHFFLKETSAVLRLELIKLKKLRKEGYLFNLRELAQFRGFILEVIVSCQQHALHIAGWRVHFEIKCYFMCF